jgi:hypothetical protein
MVRDGKALGGLEMTRGPAWAGTDLGVFDRIITRVRLARFISKLMRGIREAGETDEVRFDPEQQAILQIREGEVVGVINPSNLFGTYLRLPRAERPGFIRHCVRMALTRHKELPEDFESASPDLRPRIWARASLEHERLKSLIEGKDGTLADLPSQPVGEHLLAMLVYDWPESVQSVTDKKLEDWGVSLYEAMEVARRNLEEVTTSYAKIGENLYCFATGDSYDASRLTLVDRIAALEVSGEPVAMVPTRGQLYLTGSEDEVGLAMMAELAGHVSGDPYPLSSVPLILREGEWTDWVPPEGHPLHGRFKEIATNWLGTLYAEQKPMLEARVQQQDLDVFVASFSAVKRKDGEIVSYCVWGEGVDYLLPLTQKVVFLKREGESAAALGTWDQVQEVAGGLLEATDYYPRRYRTLGFPDDATLHAIGVGDM